MWMKLVGGTIYATVPETKLIEHKCMVPPLSAGKGDLGLNLNGQYKINDRG